MAEQIPWFHVGNTSTSNPFASFGTDWCARCKMECECDMDCVTQGDTLTYKKTCRRCGRVICWGIYDRVVMIDPGKLPPQAFEWVFTPATDRRYHAKR